MEPTTRRVDVGFSFSASCGNYASKEAKRKLALPLWVAYYTPVSSRCRIFLPLKDALSSFLPLPRNPDLGEVIQTPVPGHCVCQSAMQVLPNAADFLSLT